VREKAGKGEAPFDRGYWTRAVELGWTAMAIPEEHGGAGGGMLDACLFMEETSRGLAPIGGYATTLIVACGCVRIDRSSSGSRSTCRRSSSASYDMYKGQRKF